MVSPPILSSLLHSSITFHFSLFRERTSKQLKQTKTILKISPKIEILKKREKRRNSNTPHIRIHTPGRHTKLETVIYNQKTCKKIMPRKSIRGKNRTKIP